MAYLELSAVYLRVTTRVALGNALLRQTRTSNPEATSRQQALIAPIFTKHLRLTCALVSDVTHLVVRRLLLLFLLLLLLLFLIARLVPVTQSGRYQHLAVSAAT